MCFHVNEFGASSVQNLEKLYGTSTGNACTKIIIGFILGSPPRNLILMTIIMITIMITIMLMLMLMLMIIIIVETGLYFFLFIILFLYFKGE